MINMRKKYFSLTALITAGLLMASTNLFAAMTAKQIADKMKVNSVKVEYQKGLIVAVKGKRKKKRAFVAYIKEFPNGGAKSLLAITQPASLKGSAVLSISQPGGAKQSYLFLPATKKMTKLGKGGGGSDPGKGILGTDFAPGDLSFGNVSWSDAKVLKDAKVSGQDCYVIKINNPKASSKALYNKRVMYISKKHLLPLKVKMMKGKKTVKLIKVFKVKKVKNVYRVVKMAIGNMKKKTKTIVTMTSFKIGKGSFSDKVFSKRSVKSMKYLK